MKIISPCQVTANGDGLRFVKPCGLPINVSSAKLNRRDTPFSPARFVRAKQRTEFRPNRPNGAEHGVGQVDVKMNISVRVASVLWLSLVLAGSAQAQVFSPPSACLTCQGGQEYRIVYQTVYDEREVTAYRIETETVCDERKVTTYRPVWENEVRQRRYKVYRPVTETSTREERYTVSRPVWETQMRDESYNRVRYVEETAEREERYTVSRPVWETAEREVCQTVLRPVRETVYRTQTSTVNEAVTTYRTQYVDQGSYADQLTYKPGKSRSQLSWQQRANVYDPATGTVSQQRGGLYLVPTQQQGRYEVNRTWQPNLVAQQIPQTTLVPRIVSQQVPVEVCRMQPEQVCRKVPYRVCRMVQEEVVRKVPYTVRRPVVERVEKQVPVRVCRMVQEEKVRQVPVTTCRTVCEERVEDVTVRVCRMVATEQTVRIPRSVEKRVPITYTCRVPRTVCCRVPIDPCTGAATSGVSERISDIPDKRTVYSVDQPTKAADNAPTDPADKKPELPAAEPKAESGDGQSAPKIPETEKRPAAEGVQAREAVRRLPLVKVVSRKSA